MYISDDDRYGRLRLIPWWDQARLQQSRVLVVGAGALGNEVLKNLALVGVGWIMVVDCDAIEPSNLARSVLFRSRDRGRSKAVVAAESLVDLNPEIQVAALHGNVITAVGLGVFRDVDVVIGCLDNREARLWVNRQCWKVSTPWIDAGIQEINGVVKVFVPPESACYECGMTETDYRLINLRYSCPLLTRDEILAGKVPTSPTIASMMAGLQVQESLKLLHGMPVSAGRAHIYNGIANQWYTTEFQRRDDCLSHEVFDRLVELPLSTATHTGRDLIEMLANHMGAATGTDNWEIQLDRDLIVSLDCECGSRRPVMKAAVLVAMREATCPDCGQMARPRLADVLRVNDPLLDQPLGELGIPPYDIVRVRTAGGDLQVVLAGDRPSVLRPTHGSGH